MTAETLTGSRAKASVPLFEPMGLGAVGFAYGTYEITAAVEDGDIFEMFRLPPGVSVIDGFIRGDDMDTGIEALDMDVGWAANGTEAADPDGFGNLGVWTAGINAMFSGALKDGPVAFSAETVIQVEANVAAATFAAGTVYVGAYYIKTIT